jgi:hypothetical protein
MEQQALQDYRTAVAQSSDVDPELVHKPVAPESYWPQEPKDIVNNQQEVVMTHSSDLVDYISWDQLRDWHTPKHKNVHSRSYWHQRGKNRAKYHVLGSHSRHKEILDRHENGRLRS